MKKTTSYDEFQQLLVRHEKGQVYFDVRFLTGQDRIDLPGMTARINQGNMSDADLRTLYQMYLNDALIIF